ncbi:MAG: DUF86 domain-containing protein [Planctomycetales bacterium]|nr:DUF86 domain-containing protein [Planctomycetales bacterium]
MSRRDPQILLDDIRRAIDKIERYITGMDHDQFLSDEKTIDAVVRNLEIIGEAVRQVPDAFRQSRPEVPWAQIAGLRNRIVHDYFGLDLEIIWQVLESDLPNLKEKLFGGGSP